MLAAEIEILGNLIVGVVFGIVCALIASSRGRSPVAWFFLGLFLACIALVLVLVLPDLKQMETQLRQQELENRRLREQLAKERQVADQRHQNVERRLGAHDQALGLDTAEPPLLANAGVWYYARGNERLGPVAAETIRHLLQAQAIRGDTLVWREGMADWAPVRTTDEFGRDCT
jgi:hypothetical protein